MSGLALAGRYAKALFELAQKNNCLNAVEGDLTQLMKTAASSKDLGSAINNPVISKNNIENILAQVLKKSGANKLTINFINVLVQNGRIKFLAEVVSAFESLMMQSRHEENAYITTADVLNSKQVADAEQALGGMLGSKIKAICTVDEKILGGIIVRIGSKMLDASIAGQLDKLAMLNKKAIANLN